MTHRIQVVSERGRRVIWVAVVLVAVLAGMAFFAERSTLRTLSGLLILVALGQLWNLLAGYAGIFSFGQQAYVGIGAYTTFALADIAGWSLWPSVAAAAVVSAGIAFPTAWFVFRLKAGYFAVGTWVVAEAYRLIVKNNQTLNPRGTPQPLRALAELGEARFTSVYVATLVVAVGCTVGAYALRRSHVGLALSAARDSVEAAQASGVRVRRTQVLVYLVVAAVTGLVGAVYLLNNVSIDPDSYFAIALTAEMVVVVVVGGLGTIEGPIVGAVLFVVLRENLSDLGTWWFITLGVALVAVMLRAPSGIWGAVAARTGWSAFPVTRTLLPDQQAVEVSTSMGERS